MRPAAAKLMRAGAEEPDVPTVAKLMRAGAGEPDVPRDREAESWRKGKA